MASITELKNQIDLDDLAAKLGLVKPAGNTNYLAPHRKEKAPSLSVYANGTKWKDHGGDGEAGSCIDLVMYVNQVEAAEAIRWLHEIYGIPMDRPQRNEPQQKSLAQFIADKCFQNTAPAIEYLTGRGLSKEIVELAIKKKAVGFNDHIGTDKKSKLPIPAGKYGHGGPGVAFITRSMNPGRVMAVDMRYFDPELNGGVKTQCQGEKTDYPWYLDLQKLKAAETVYLVESPINALSIEDCNIPKSTAVAIRGATNIRSMDFRFLIGKRVILGMDNDLPDEFGKRAGTEAAWALYDKLTALNIATHIVDHEPWKEFKYNDVNDILKDVGPRPLQTHLAQLEQWAIPGMPGKYDPNDEYNGRARLYLPSHDYAKYWRFRCQEDFTSLISTKKDKETGEEYEVHTDLCGFRVASISRVSIASSKSVMSGEPDLMPRVQFSVTVQIPRHGNKLLRKVFDDERLHNPDQWRKFGPIYSAAGFSRLINILERAADLGARNAINFVGLAWQDGKPKVNEGPDCYFSEPEKQCPYYNLTFPSGSQYDAKRVIDAYQATFKQNAASLLLVWSLGAHLKAFLGFWPHMVLQANKGAGKSTLVQKMESSIGFTMFSGQSLQTEFRLLTSISHTSHPVGWEEISARRQDVIDKAVSMLQECYQSTMTKRGSDMTEYLQSAAVLLAGEDVPVQSLLGKVVRTDLSGKKGDILPDDLPRFPVLQWLNFLAAKTRADIKDMHARAKDYCDKHCRASGDDDGAARMLNNYASMLMAWRLLCEFADINYQTGNFVHDLLTEMNSHISETSADREPWVWILDTIFAEISSGKFHHPFTFKSYSPEGEPIECILIRPNHIMQHIRSETRLRDMWNSLPIKTDRILKQQLDRAEVILKDRVDATIHKKREHHLVALSLPRLGEYGLHVSTPEVMDEASESEMAAQA